MPDQKLVEYARRFFKLRYPHGNIGVEEAAEFASQLRDGCHQDMVRLFEKFLKDVPPESTGKEAVHAVGCAINEGGDIRLWGMPDCRCNKADCVYCGRGLA